MIEAEIKTIRNLITACNVLVIVSIFIFGVPLDIAAIICALIARSKFNNLVHQNNIAPDLEAFYRRKAKLAIILSILMAALNAFSAYMTYPYMTDYINSQMGQFSGIQGSSSVPNNGSIWG